MFYKLKPPAKMRLGRASKPKLQNRPGSTDTGMTSAGVMAAIIELGGTCDLDALVSKLKPAMVADDKLVAWAKKNSGSRNRKVVDSITIDDARRAAVRMMCDRVRSSHDVKIVTRVTIIYTPPKELPESSTSLGDSPAAQ
jgi:hypothetical protein